MGPLPYLASYCTPCTPSSSVTEPSTRESNEIIPSEPNFPRCTTSRSQQLNFHYSRFFANLGTIVNVGPVLMTGLWKFVLYLNEASNFMNLRTIIAEIINILHLNEWAKCDHTLGERKNTKSKISLLLLTYKENTLSICVFFKFYIFLFSAGGEIRATKSC